MPNSTFNSMPTTMVQGNSKIRFNDDGGLELLLVNKTGAPSVKGTVVSSHTTDFGVIKTIIDRPDPYGIIAESDVADGDNVWVTVSGIAEVLFVGDAVAGHFARICVAGDADAADGKAISEVRPSSPFATDKHFMEIGYVITSHTGAGLAKVILHFN
jgi:hypothetical protein